jgi:hypothetical protein
MTIELAWAKKGAEHFILDSATSWDLSFFDLIFCFTELEVAVIFFNPS